MSNNIPPNKTSVDVLLNTQEPPSSQLNQLAAEVLNTPDTPISPNSTTIEGEVAEVEEVDEEEDVSQDKLNPTISLFGVKYDRDSFVIGFLIIFIWAIVWITSGLRRTLFKDYSMTAIFFIFIIYILVNIFTSGKKSGSTIYELNILLTVEQMISILFGTVILFALFEKNLPVHQNCRSVIFKLNVSIIIVLTLASMWVNIFSSGRSFRFLRKFKQGIYNVALMLFIIIGLIFYKGNNCPKFKSQTLPSS